MAKVDTNPEKIEEILTRGVHEVFTKEELKEKLLSGKKLHLKLGTDVTGPNLHLGHTVVQRKIRDFQELGHKVTLIIGDYTTLVGDHSDKVDMRAEVSAEEIEKNVKTYTDQFFKTVKKEDVDVRRNSEWLSELKFIDLINLTKQFTIAQMLDRETFMLRYKNNTPIGLDEFMYPLMQGYDSVALNCDVEFGGTDQTFNLLAGRKIMPFFKQKPQSAVVMRLLTGSDGKPMGKSLQNFIPVMSSPNDMYGKLMSIVDEVIFEYFELVTRVPMNEIKEMKKEMKSGNPMDFKKRLAREVVEFYHDAKAATEAEEHFEKTVQLKELPEEMTILELDGNSTLLDTLKLALGEEVSGGDIKRTVKQGGVEVNGIKVTNPNDSVENKSGDVIKFGKRRFIKIK
ncbi:tyrosine--tRNA ligase [candidate division WWE3 bacterium]|jgi:tyrosyl-tRNA synthetase|nr:tyrosine--tRNA ligase [candidate division WWE3 bacterium]MBT7349225.1 tyrosine--tRNA ligase [candidate division WWE3 bacterium]